MDNLQLLEKIGFDKTYLDDLKDTVFCRPQIDKTRNICTIKILSKHFLAKETLTELENKLALTLGTGVNIVMEVLGEDVTIELLMTYIDYFQMIKGEKINSIPIIADNMIYLNIEDEEIFKSVTAFLKQQGIKLPILKERANIALNENNVVIAEAPVVKSESRRRSSFTKAEDYKISTMSRLTASSGKVCIVGKVFNIDFRSGTSKNTNRYYEIETTTITDFTDAIIFKRFTAGKLPEDITINLYEGQVIKVYGTVKYDTYENTNIIDPERIEEMENDPFVLNDDYEGLKHINMHVHTNRSEMDGVSNTADLVKNAFRLGQDAIAITDTNVVQAYPLAQSAHFDIKKKYPDKDFKVIYGIDVHIADDQLKMVYNPTDQKLIDSEYAVIDFETTGLSTRYDHIIEFGGIIVRNNVVTDERIQLFVKPPVRVPDFICNKTNITNEMLENADPIEIAIDKMLDFIGDRVIVAHNADFDFNFLNDTLVSLGREPLKNTCLDTLNLARQIVKDRKFYRLGVIAKYYHVEYDEDTAHRGDYDAEVLAEMLVKMIKDIDDYQNVTFNQIQNNQDSNNFKKAHTYTATLLAKNMAGIKSIYEIVSLSHTKYLTYFAKENVKKVDSEVQAEPRILKSEIEKRRENIIVGSCDQYSELFEIAMNRSMDDLQQCMKFYDYIEIQPLENYANLLEPGSAFNKDRLKNIINDIIFTAAKLNIPVIGTADVYYSQPYEKIARDVYVMAKRIGGVRHPLYPMNREKRKNFCSADQYLMPTEEILEKFAFLGQQKAKEICIDNPHKINDQIEKLFPIPTELSTPEIEGSEQILKNVIYQTAHETYGDPLPKIVSDRIEKELNNVIKNGFTVQYYIAHLLVKQSEADGYPVGSRGSVGSSFIATMAKITEVNPLCPHYVCPNCKHSEFFENNEYANGFDLPDKCCPHCGTPMKKNGHNIPFETFLGFDGDKVPDIDLNFSPDYQANAMLQIKEIFGEDYSYRAGTIGTVAQKTAYGHIKGYSEETEKPYFSKAFSDVLSKMCEGVKRTTGQHPGGIVVIPKTKEIHDFSPIQYPANNPFSDWLTTHFAFADLHDNILKLDVLAHIDPTSIRLLSLFSGVHYKDVPMDDPKVYSIFSSTDALNIIDTDDMYHEVNGGAGLPEFGTHNNRRILNKTKPHTFYELVAFEGVTHGTDVWSNNAELLIDSGQCTLAEVISCRDDIMSYLISKGMDKKESFQIMEKVRKGKGLTAQWIEDMNAHDVPEWYINSCQLIKYMFPKAHAVAYAMNAVRVAWYKVYRPAAYYAVFFSIRCDAYDVETMIAGKTAIYNLLHEIQSKIENNEKVTAKEEALETTLEIALEMYCRGYHFTNISLEKSDAVYFRIDPDDDHGIIPSFNSIDGLGEAVANSIVEQRKIRPFISKEDFIKRTSVNNTQCAFMDKLNVFDGLTDEDQLSLF